MHNFLLASIILNTVFVCSAATTDAQALIDTILKQKETTVQQAYQNYHKAIDPIIEKYQKIRNNAIQKANSKALLRLNLAKKQAEARKDDVAVAKIENTIVELKKENKEVGGWGETKEVTIPSTSEKGVLLGELDRGCKLKLSYIEGKWEVGPKIKVMINPDDKTLAHEKHGHRLFLVGPNEISIMIPTNTVRIPFVYEIKIGGPYRLVMGDEKGHGNNLGSVKYKVTLVK